MPVPLRRLLGLCSVCIVLGVLVGIAITLDPLLPVLGVPLGTRSSSVILTARFLVILGPVALISAAGLGAGITLHTRRPAFGSLAGGLVGYTLWVSCIVFGLLNYAVVTTHPMMRQPFAQQLARMGFDGQAFVQDTTMMMGVLLVGIIFSLALGGVNFVLAVASGNVSSWLVQRWVRRHSGPQDMYTPVTSR